MAVARIDTGHYNVSVTISVRLINLFISDIFVHLQITQVSMTKKLQ